MKFKGLFHQFEPKWYSDSVKLRMDDAPATN